MGNTNEIIQAARLKLSVSKPYFSTALWALRFIESDKLGTMGVDKHWRLYYNPTEVSGWTINEMVGVLVHELNHLLCGHSERAECIGINESTHALANICQDASINEELIKDMTVELPTGVDSPILVKTLCRLYCQHEQGKSKTNKCKFELNSMWEEYYLALCSCADKKECCNNYEAGQPKKSGNHKHIVCPIHDVITINICVNCGSGAHGVKQDYEDDSSVDGISPAEAELIRRQTAREILEHHKNRGNVPEGWLRWANEKLNPRVNWRRELACLMRRAVSVIYGMVDYTYQRPSRRQSIANNIIFPSLIKPVPKIALAIDTSGSMSDVQMAQGVAEVGGVLKALGLSNMVTVMSVDAAVHTCQKIFSERQIKLMGGGGTSMTAAFEYASKLKPLPNVLIVLTDAYSNWPEKSFPFFSIVAIIGDHDGKDIPKWIKVIHIKDS